MEKSRPSARRASAREAIGVRLKISRQWLGLTQKELGQELGLTKLSVLHYEAGKTPLPTDLLPVLERLGVDSAWLATGIPCLEYAFTRQQFAVVLDAVKRGAAVRAVEMPEEDQVETAWNLFLSTGPDLHSHKAPRDIDKRTARLNELLAATLGPIPMPETVDQGNASKPGRER